MLRPCGDFKESYKEDEQVFKTRFTRWAFRIFLVFLFFLPFFCKPYYLHLLNIIGIYIIGAVGLNILIGYTGQISIGHGAFMGLGAYCSALLYLRLGIPFPFCLLLGALMTSFMGVIIGLPSIRIKGMYLAMITLAAQVCFTFAVVNTPGLTGGDLGLTIPSPLESIHWDHGKIFYYIIIAFTVLGLIMAKNLFRTKVGRAFIGIRDYDIAAEIIGIEVGRYKLLSFCISSMYAGVAGGLWAFYFGTISHEQFTLSVSIDYIAMILIGGMGSILGSIFGAIFILLIPEFLTNLGSSLRGTITVDISSYLSIINRGLFGFLIIFFIIFEPEGLKRIWDRTRAYFKLWPFSY